MSGKYSAGGQAGYIAEALSPLIKNSFLLQPSKRNLAGWRRLMGDTKVDRVDHHLWPKGLLVILNLLLQRILEDD